MDELGRFNRYEEEFLNSTRIVTRAMRLLQIHKDDLDILISTSVECEGELSEIEGFYKAMEIEVDAMIFSEKQYSQGKLKGYAEEYEQAKQAFEELKLAAESAARKQEAASSSRSALVAANERLDRSTNSIQQSRGVLAETELIGDAIITDLETQKEMLLGAGDNVRETKRYTLDARRVLDLMSNRALMQKLFMLILVVLLFSVIWMLTYYGFIMKYRK